MIGVCTRVASLVCCAGAFALALPGCCCWTIKSNAPAPPPPQEILNVTPPTTKTDKTGGEASAGRKVFEAHCVKCHVIAGVPSPGKMMGKGPELTTVGAKRERTWIIDHIRDPQGHNKASKMPAYGAEKLSDPDLQALGDYLSSLK